MDLSIDLSREPGRPLESKAAFVRELTEADLALLDNVKLPTTRLKRLRDTHHAAARSIAAGMKHTEVALVTGYTPTRVSQLLADPAFADLVAFYRSNLDVTFAGLYEKFSAFSHEVFEELRTRFEADPDTFSNTFLAELLKLTADRSGNGPRSTQININLSLAGRLEAARRRAGLGGPTGDQISRAADMVEAEILPPPRVLAEAAE